MKYHFPPRFWLVVMIADIAPNPTPSRAASTITPPIRFIIRFPPLYPPLIEGYRGFLIGLICFRGMVYLFFLSFLSMDFIMRLPKDVSRIYLPVLLFATIVTFSFLLAVNHRRLVPFCAGLG
jgi:hypothetical protein